MRYGSFSRIEMVKIWTRILDYNRMNVVKASKYLHFFEKLGEGMVIGESLISKRFLGKLIEKLHKYKCIQSETKNLDIKKLK